MQEQDQAEQNQGQQGQDDYEQHRQEFAGQFFGTEAAIAPPAAKVEETTETAPQDKADAAASTDQASTEVVDPLADAPAYVRDMAAQLKTTTDQLGRMQQQLRSQGGRQGALAKSLKALQGSLSQPVQMDPQYQEEETRFARDFPEAAAILERRTTAMQNDLQKRTQAIVDNLADPLAEGAQLTEQETAQAAGYHALDTAEEFADVRDWQQVVRHPDFAPWLRTQPGAVQSLANSNDAVDAAYLFRQFKANSPAYQQAMQQQQQASALQSKREKVLAQNTNMLGRSAQQTRTPDENDGEHWRAHYAKQLGLR